MQAHVRHVEKLTNFMSPVGLSISHYNSHPSRKRQRFNNLSNPPNVTGNLSSGSGTGSGSDSEPQPASNSNEQSLSHSHARHSHGHGHGHAHSHRNNSSQHHAAESEMKETLRENQWTRQHLSLRHARNRSMYLEAESAPSSQSRDAMNSILDKLVIYGYETSADIAKMQPWQLRVLKKEIPQIDYIFMTAYRMWGKQEYYDDHLNLTFRQYWDPAVWLQYNEIELIVKCFDAGKRGYQCMICRTTHGLYELDQVRWHIWLEHKQSTQLNAVMQASKKNNDFTHLQLPSLSVASRGGSTDAQEKSAQRQVISLLDDSTDDEMEVIATQRRSASVHNSKENASRQRYSNKARQYNSRRRGNEENHSHSRRRRSNRQSRVVHSKAGNTQASSAQPQAQPIQNPIIVNGCNEEETAQHEYPQYTQYVNTAQVHTSQSPAFMPSAQLHGQPIHSNNGSTTILQTMSSMKNSSNYSLDSHDTTMDMEMDTEFHWKDSHNVHHLAHTHSSEHAHDNDNVNVHVASTQHDGNSHRNDNNHSHASMNDNNSNHNKKVNHASPDMEMDEFNMIGFNDDFSTLGVMGVLSRNSSADSFNGALHLNSSFADPHFSFEAPQRFDLDSMNHMI